MTAGAPALTALLDELDRLRAAATPGPWTVRVEGGTDADAEGWREVSVDFGDGPSDPGLVLGDHESAEADAALIVAAVNAVGPLTAAVRAALALADDLDSYISARGRPERGTYDDGLNRAQAAAAADLRSALAAALEAAP